MLQVLRISVGYLQVYPRRAVLAVGEQLVLLRLLLVLPTGGGRGCTAAPGPVWLLLLLPGGSSTPAVGRHMACYHNRNPDVVASPVTSVMADITQPTHTADGKTRAEHNDRHRLASMETLLRPRTARAARLQTTRDHWRRHRRCRCPGCAASTRGHRRRRRLVGSLPRPRVPASRPADPPAPSGQAARSWMEF